MTHVILFAYCMQWLASGIHADYNAVRHLWPSVTTLLDLFPTLVVLWATMIRTFSLYRTTTITLKQSLRINTILLAQRVIIVDSLHCLNTEEYDILYLELSKRIKDISP